MPLVTPTRPDLEQDDQVDLDRPWVVIVWDDPINLMNYVTMVLQKIFGFSRQKADKLMKQVHYEGKAVVFSGTRDHSEVYVTRLQEHGLWATLRQDD